MYWKEIPVQVQAQDADGDNTVSKPLDGRFQQGVDAISMFDGSSGTDDYLDGWDWGEFQVVEGSPREAAAQVAARSEQRFPPAPLSRNRGPHVARPRGRLGRAVARLGIRALQRPQEPLDGVRLSARQDPVDLARGDLQRLRETFDAHACCEVGKVAQGFLGGGIARWQLCHCWNRGS